MITSSSQKNIFIAYSQQDHLLLEKLVSHLSVLERSGRADVWFDGEIEAGAEWEKTKVEALQNADIILLLISADFINSDYCYDVEMQGALQRHEAGTAQVVPILMRDCAWELTPFAKLKILPTNQKPIANDKLQVSDQALADVVEEINALVSPHARTPEKKKEQEKTPAVVVQKTVTVKPTSNGISKKLISGIIGIAFLGLVFFGISKMMATPDPTPTGQRDNPTQPTLPKQEEQDSSPKFGNTADFATVSFGPQVWMAENLKVKSQAAVCYDDLKNNCSTYGSLLTIAAAKTACPDGWHLPTLKEWKRLLKANGETLSSTSKGKVGYQFLSSESFNLLPAGMLQGQPRNFKHLNEVGYYWTSSNATGDDYYVLKIDKKAQRVEMIKEYYGRRNGFSCRCVQD